MSLLIPMFSEPVRGSAGSFKKWTNWKTRFTALLEMSGVANMLTRENELNALTAASIKANATAWCLLVCALSGEPFDLIQDTPDNHVGTAWKLLTTKYEKEGMSDLSYLMRELFECKWRSKDVDPSIWLADMRTINRRIVAATRQDKTDLEWIALIRSNTEIPEFQQLYMMLSAAGKTRRSDWETEICNMWNRRCRSRTTAPAANNIILRRDGRHDAAYMTATASQNEPENQPAAYENRYNSKTNYRQSRHGFRCDRNRRQADSKASYHTDSTYSRVSYNNNAEYEGFGGLSHASISCYSYGRSDYISCERCDRKADCATTSQHEAAGLYFLGNLEYRETAEGSDVKNDFSQGSANSLGIFKPVESEKIYATQLGVKAKEFKPFQPATQNGHCEEYCLAKPYEKRNNKHRRTLFNNHDEVKDCWKRLFKDYDTKSEKDDFASERYVDSDALQVAVMDTKDNNKPMPMEVELNTAPNFTPVQNIVEDTVPHVLEDNPTATEEKNDEDENIIEFQPEGERLFDNQEQWVPPAFIEVGRMTEDPSDEIIRPADEPTIHDGKMSEPVITHGRRTKAPEVVLDQTLNNIFPPNEVGRNGAEVSPESLDGPTLAQRRQKLRDLRAAIKIRLDNYVHNEMGNMQAGRTRVAASTQSVSTQGLAQARQRLQDLRTDIKIRLDNYVRRETGNQQNLQHLSGTESTVTPTTTLEKVRTLQHMTLEKPEKHIRTPLRRLADSYKTTGHQTRHTDIQAHFVFDRGKVLPCLPSTYSEQLPQREAIYQTA
jgi:hypothetical protein